jgi:hypothetical protein
MLPSDPLRGPSPSNARARYTDDVRKRAVEIIIVLFAIGCKSESGVMTTRVQLPSCNARAPANASGFYPEDALPQGACKNDPKCQIQIERPCACSAIGSVDEYTCTCTNGNWGCAIDEQSGACTCTGTEADAAHAQAQDDAAQAQDDAAQAQD